MLDELNPQQREVAELRQNCVAIACPGAGKTKTIATKAALLLQEDAAVVGAVTFSKDAAIELRDRIRRGCGQGREEAADCGYVPLSGIQAASAARRPGARHCLGR